MKLKNLFSFILASYRFLRVTLYLADFFMIKFTKRYNGRNSKLLKFLCNQKITSNIEVGTKHTYANGCDTIDLMHRYCI